VGEGRARGRCAGGARVVAEQVGLQGAQLGAGFDTQLVDEGGPGFGVGGQCLAAAAEVAVGDHPRRPEPLAQRLLGEGELQLGERALGSARAEQSADVRLAQAAADLLEPGGRRPGPRLVGHRAVGTATPEGGGILGALQRADGRPARQQLTGSGGQRGEAAGVDAVGRNDQPVAAGLAQQHRGRRAGRPFRFEQLAQPPDVRVQRGRGPGDALVTPHGLAQRVGAHGVARVDEQEREGRFEPGTTDRPRGAVAFDRERSEVAEPQALVSRSHSGHGGGGPP
jgi:hypothetical protein